MFHRPPNMLPYMRAILAALIRIENQMSDLSTAADTLKADVETLIADLPATIAKAVGEALNNAGVDAATVTAALEATDAEVKAALAGMTPPAP